MIDDLKDLYAWLVYESTATDGITLDEDMVRFATAVQYAIDMLDVAS